MADFTEIQLPELERVFERRYPGVQVQAWMRHRDSGESFRTVRFDGSESDLDRHGLIPSGLEFERLHYVADEFGSEIAGGRMSDGLAYVYHHHEVHTGAVKGQRPSQHPDNAKTRTVVAKILKRLAAKAYAPS